MSFAPSSAASVPTANGSYCSNVPAPLGSPIFPAAFGTHPDISTFAGIPTFLLCFDIRERAGRLGPLDAAEHILPHGFVKIRHYGLLASGNVTTRLERARALLGASGAERDEQRNEPGSEPDESWPELLAAVAAVDVTLCPSCGAHAVQRGPLPLSYPTSARAPPGIAA